MSLGRHPYPGLRPFRRDESDLFFGREGCVNEMVDRLGVERFLAVLGPSGGGKSSLVRTGLFDALDLGFLHAAGSDWLIVDMHPAGQPLRQLAAALLQSVKPEKPSDAAVESMTKRLRQGPRSVAKWAAEGNAPAGTNMLLLVDQFEELFRFAKYNQREEAEALVAMLLESAASDLYPIYVVITMRSEYLGACSSIDQLAEHISKGLYLTPRMSREACRQAIEGPAGVIGFRIEPALVNRMLNDLATFTPRPEEDANDLATQLALQADQLPLMQHVLNRLWLRAQSAPHEGPALLTLADYNALGGMTGAIDAHGEEVLASLSEDARAAVEPIFRALVTGNSLATAVRRPEKVGELVKLAGGTEKRRAVEEVVEAFRSPTCSFLRTSTTELNDDTLVDITHESLIRQWSSLRRWLDEEIRDDAQWRRLLARRNEGDPLTGISLDNFRAWWDSSQPTQAWAERHGGKFEEVHAFLTQSAAEEEQRIRSRQRRLWGTVAAVTTCLLIAALLIALWQREVRKMQTNEEELGVRADQSNQQAASSKQQAVLLEQSALGLEETLDKTVANFSRNVGDPWGELYFLTKILKAEQANNNGDPPDNALLRNMFATALDRTSGQVAFLGGLQGHQGPINSAWFTPNGQWVLTSGNDRRVIVWDAKTGRMRMATPPAPDSVISAKTSADGRMLVTATKNGIATVYSVPDGHLIATFSPTPATPQVMFDATFSSDGKLLATASWDGIVRIWTVPSRNSSQPITSPLIELSSPEKDSAVAYGVAFVPGHEHTLLLAVEDTPSNDATKRKGLARLWNYRTGTTLGTRTLDSDYITSIARDPGGDFILAGAGDAQVWNPVTNGHYSLEGAKSIEHVAISRNGRWIVTSSGSQATLWSTVSLASRTLQAHRADIADLGFSPDSKLVITASSDGSAKIWDVATGQLVASLDSHGHIAAAQFSPLTSNIVVTASDDHTALLWDTGEVYKAAEVIPQPGAANDIDISPDDKLAIVASDGGAMLYDRAARRAWPLLQGSKVAESKFSPDGRYAVTADAQAAAATVWDVAKRARAYPPLKTGSKDSVDVARFSPDSRWVVTVAGTNAAVWRVRDGKFQFGADLDGKSIYGAAFDASGKYLVLVGDAPVVPVYSVETGRRVFVLTHENRVTRASYSSDGHRILTSSWDGTAKIWDAKTGKLLLTLPCPTPLHESKFSPDNKRVATSGENGKIDLWDANTGNHLRSFDGQSDTVFSTEFNSAGSMLATTSTDGSLYVWDVATGEEIVSFEEGPSVNQTIFVHRDPHLLAVASSDGRATLWQVQPDNRSLSDLNGQAERLLLTAGQDTEAYWDSEIIGIDTAQHAGEHEAAAAFGSSSSQNASGTAPGKSAQTAGKQSQSDIGHSSSLQVKRTDGH